MTTQSVHEKLMKWAKWIIQQPHLCDGACRQCRPDGEYLIEGFLCTYHDAVEYLNTRGYV